MRIFSLLAIVLLANQAMAQYGWGYGGYRYAPIGEATSGVQARDEGVADLIRARGQYEQDHAAAVAAMDAENQLQIQRRMQQRQAYYAMQQQKAAEIRQRNTENRASLQQSQNQMLPKPLPANQFDPATGEIKWPVLLMRPEFETTRSQVGQLFQQWAAAGRSGQPFDPHPIVAAVKAMRDQLKSLISSVDTMSYLAARSFLDSLEVSARIPASQG